MLRLFNTVVILVILICLAHIFLGGPLSPGPGPDPITPVVAGFHVLIVEETSTNRAWNYNDKMLDDFADKSCAKINGTPEFRIYDKDQDLSHASKDWQAAMEDAKKHDPPWVETWGTKKQRSSEALPADAESTVKLLEKKR